MSSGLGVCANERRCGGVIHDSAVLPRDSYGSTVGERHIGKKLFFSIEFCVRLEIESQNVVLLSYFRLSAQRVSVIGPRRCMIYPLWPMC
jgi:hypothetical protein